MLEELNRQLAAILERNRVQDKLQTHYQKVKVDQEAATAKRERLAKVLQHEAADVAKLEGISLQALFYTLLGNKGQQVEKEKQEYLAAKLKQDESCETLKDLEQEEKQLDQQLKASGSIEVELK